MTPDERQMIGDLFERIAKNQEPAAQMDREADAFIRGAVQRDPGAAYTLTQMALVQEHALKLADERIRELEAKLGPAADAAPKRSFMDGLLPNSPWARRTSVPSVGGGTPMLRPGAFGAAGPAPAAPAGGSFLRSAFATAAGVAGGLMLFEAVRGLMSGSAGGAFASSAVAAAPQEAALPPPPELAPRDSASDYTDTQSGDDTYVADNDSAGDFESGSEA